jgi:hypothetical protein
MISALLLLGTLALAQLGQPSNYGNGGTMTPPPPKKAPTTRNLTGQVFNQKDDLVADAVVYLKDPRTNAIRTYITAKDGAYHFSGLSQNQDYEVYAQVGKVRSNTRTLSSFDSRANPNLNLKVDVESK